MSSNYILRESLTICAPVTAPASAGVAVIRVSGDAALKRTAPLAPFLPEKPESHRVYYGRLKYKDDILDEVLVSYFEKGRSFTGEETLEISCHGSLSVQNEIVSALCEMGCVPALRGEFTFRAFNNGRIDLVQAESVLSLINSQTPRASRLALRQLSGELSKSALELEDDVVWVMANIEAGIDFSTEDIDVIDSKEIQNRVQRIVGSVSRLVSSYKNTRPLVEGLRVVLAGLPNAGKSSLLNALLEQERAIVTEIPGTTRDAIEASLKLSSGYITLVDTAGLRETEDRVEKLGIQITQQEIDAADLVFYLFEKSLGLSNLDKEYLSKIPEEKKVLIATKMDISVGVKNTEASPLGQAFEVSATQKTGLDKIKEFLDKNLAARYVEDSAVIIQKRHFELLTEVSNKAQKALKLLQENASYEFVALELQETLRLLYELLGKEYNDQVMDRVFKEFCIGK